MFSRLFKKAPFKNMHCHIIYVRRKKHIWLNHVNSVATELLETNVSSYLKLHCMSKLFVEHQRFYNVSETLKQKHLLFLMHVMCNHDLLIPGE